MSTYREMRKNLGLDGMSTQQLLDLSTAIDQLRINGTPSDEIQDDLATIADKIAKLIQGTDTVVIGNKLYDEINRLIVKKNSDSVKQHCREPASDVDQKKYGGTYRVMKTRSGFVFSLVARNGEVLVISDPYACLDSCMSGIESVKRTAGSPIEDQTREDAEMLSNPKYELYLDKMGEYRFRLKSRNGASIAHSEGYKSKESCEMAIKSVSQVAGTNDIEKK